MPVPVEPNFPEAIPAGQIPRSRRAVLAGVLGGMGAWAAAAVGRASPVRADGENIQIGSEYDTAVTVTRLSNTANNETVFRATSAAGGTAVRGETNAGVGISGDSNAFLGVGGHSETGIGVYGDAVDGVGVMGSSQHHVGVRGFSYELDWPAIDGISRANGTGVIGLTTGGPTDVPSVAKAKTGVYGQATQDGGSRGVWGRSNAGQGVRGQATSGIGLYGTATTGFALQTAGRAKFSTSGVATIAKGNVSVLVTPGVNVVASTFVLLTPKANLGGRDLWFTTNATANTFTIRLSSPRSSGTKVAWLLLG